MDENKTMTPALLLFRNPEMRLFSNQTELAKKIIRLENSRYSKKPIDSIKSLLSKSIRGKRRISQYLLDAILAVIKKEAGDEQLETMKRKLPYAFENIFLQSPNKYYVSDEGTIPGNFFQKMEEKSKGLEVLCITSDLDLLWRNLDEKIIAAQSHGTIFKYLLNNFIAQKNLYEIRERITKAGLGDKIQIIEAYDLVSIRSLDIEKTSENPINKNMIFPMFQDLVAYRNIPEEICRKYNFRSNEIVAMVPSQFRFDDGPVKSIRDYICQGDIEITNFILWFNNVWRSCDRAESA